MGFDPISMAVLAAASGGVQVMGALNEGKANSNAAAYRAQVARNNEIIANQNAKWAEQQGNAEESAQGMKTRAGVGRLVAGQSATGVDVNTGSYADVQDAASALGELDAMTIRSNMSRKVYAYKADAASKGAEAQLLDAESRNAKQAGKLKALSSALSAASSVGGKFAGWQSTAGAPTALGNSGINYAPDDI